MRKLKEIPIKEAQAIIPRMIDDVDHLWPIHLIRTGRCKVYVDWRADGGIDMAMESTGKHKIVFVDGKESSEPIRDWLNGFDKKAEFLCCPKISALLTDTLDIKVTENAILHLLKDEKKTIAASLDERLRKLDENDIKMLEAIDDDGLNFSPLWDNAADILQHAVVYGFVDDGELLSYAIGGVESETLVDIGVWTAKNSRRKGYSYQCAVALINDIISRGKRVTWGTFESNAASMKFAEKLGFVKESELFYCTN